MKYSQFNLKADETFDGQFGDWQVRNLPLRSATGIAAVFKTVNLGCVEIEWFSIRSDMYVREAYVGEGFRFSTPVAAQNGPSYFSGAMEKGHGFLSLKGFEHSYHVPEGCIGLGLTVSRQSRRSWAGTISERFVKH